MGCCPSHPQGHEHQSLISTRYSDGVLKRKSERKSASARNKKAARKKQLLENIESMRTGIKENVESISTEIKENIDSIPTEIKENLESISTEIKIVDDDKSTGIVIFDVVPVDSAKRAFLHKQMTDERAQVVYDMIRSSDDQLLRPHHVQELQHLGYSDKEICLVLTCQVSRLVMWERRMLWGVVEVYDKELNDPLTTKYKQHIDERELVLRNFKSSETYINKCRPDHVFDIGNYTADLHIPLPSWMMEKWNQARQSCLAKFKVDAAIVLFPFKGNYQDVYELDRTLPSRRDAKNVMCVVCTKGKSYAGHVYCWQDRDSSNKTLWVMGIRNSIWMAISSLCTDLKPGIALTLLEGVRQRAKIIGATAIKVESPLPTMQSILDTHRFHLDPLDKRLDHTNREYLMTSENTAFSKVDDLAYVSLSKSSLLN